MTSYETNGTVGPWAKDKLDCLRRYLIEYTKILKNYNFRFYYVDAFAGAGRARLRKKAPNSLKDQLSLDVGEERDQEDDVEFVDGSPRVALSLEDPFSGYLFIEQDEEKASELEKFANEHGLMDRVRIRPGDANEVLRERLINNDGIDWAKTRALVFLDPFGLQVPWSTIEDLASLGGVEVLINFPVGMAIQRFLERKGEISDERVSILNSYFGTDEWFDVVYSKTTDLLGENVLSKASDSGDKLAIWYCSRLKSVFGRTATPRLIRNSTGGHLYYLIWAGKNEVGQRIADYILSGMAKPKGQ